MRKKTIYFIAGILMVGAFLFSCTKEKDLAFSDPSQTVLKKAPLSGLTPTEQLGKDIFYDKNISVPAGTSCATCHGPEVGFTGPDQAINAAGAVYPGAFPGRFGNRKPPSAAYGGSSPILHQDAGGAWIGGMFWDGRATGWILGDPLAEQAQGPFLNPLEHNISSTAAVIEIIKSSTYASLFEQVYSGSLNGPVDEAFNNVGRAVAAYERSAEVSPFSSKYDMFLAGKAKLTSQEARGLEFFNGKGKCNLCHVSEGLKPLFTDFSYDNLGVPKNPANPFYTMPPPYNPAGMNWIDLGLGSFLGSIGDLTATENMGKQKVPTLRNVDKRPFKKFTKAYMHNGVFKSLDEVVHFYNTRDVETWPAPEYASAVNHNELGNLGLNKGEEIAIVAFLQTLSDGYLIKK
jgi:cytochrome c peroxidase